MEASDVSIKSILNCREFLVVLIKSYEIETFIMCYHAYKAFGTPSVGEELLSVMESTILMDKYTVAIHRNNGDMVRHLPTVKPGKFSKTIFSLNQTKNTFVVETMYLER